MHADQRSSPGGHIATPTKLVVHSVVPMKCWLPLSILHPVDRDSTSWAVRRRGAAPHSPLSDLRDHHTQTPLRADHLLPPRPLLLRQHRHCLLVGSLAKERELPHGVVHLRGGR